MMLSSNIASVIRRLERYQAELPGVIARVMVPAKYLKRLHLWAKTALMAQANTDEERALVPLFLDSITGELVEGSMLFKMFSPNQSASPAQLSSTSEEHGSVVRAQEQFFASRPPRVQGVPLGPDEQENLVMAREAVKQWVTYEKILDDRDAGLSLEEITDRLLWIMGLSDTSKFGQQQRSAGGETRQYSEVMRQAGEHLAARVQAFWDMTAQGGAMTTGIGTMGGRSSMAGFPAHTAGRGEFNAANVPTFDEQGKTLRVGEFEEPVPVMDARLATQWLAAVLATWRIELPAWIRLALEREMATMKHKVKTEL